MRSALRHGALGQFLSVDLLVDSTRQPYAYVGNSPLTSADPSGLCPVNGGSNVADCTPEDFGGNSSLLTPEMIGFGANLGFALPSIAGLGDGASGGLTEMAREANGTNCLVEKNGWYWASYAMGFVGSVVTGAAAMRLALGGIQRVAQIIPTSQRLAAHIGSAISTPIVSSQKLQNLVDGLYHGTTSATRIGAGTTADAIRNEIATGLATQGRYHLEKGANSVRGLTNWLGSNPAAAPWERIVAQSLLDDLLNALGRV